MNIHTHMLLHRDIHAVVQNTQKPLPLLITSAYAETHSMHIDCVVPLTCQPLLLISPAL